jgi:hypothetical protein
MLNNIAPAKTSGSDQETSDVIESSEADTWKQQRRQSSD